MSLLVSLAQAVFILQGFLIAVDEFVCHTYRRLPKWELIGHPLDTFCLWLYFFSLNELNFYSFPIPALLGLLSCVVITKDEWVHKELSSAFENWLHAMLFVVHPTVVISYFYLWTQGHEDFFKLLHVSLILVGGYFVLQCFMGWSKWQKA